MHVNGTTLPQKRNSSPFHLQILKLPDGVQASNGVHWNTQPIRIKIGHSSFLYSIWSFQNLLMKRRGVCFLGECIMWYGKDLFGFDIIWNIDRSVKGQGHLMFTVQG